METIQIEDGEIDVEADWTFYRSLRTTTPESILKAFRCIDEDALEKLESVNWELCREATVIKTDDDRFLLYYVEHHPEMCSAEEFCNGTWTWTKKKQAEWNELNKRMPSSHYYCWLTRSEAFHIVMAFQLPSEFLPDMQAEA